MANLWKAWKAKNPAFHPSHTLWKSLRDYHIPTASAGIFQGARARETECKALDFKGVVRMARHCHPWHGGSKGHHGQSDDAAPCQTRYHGNLHARELWEGARCSARVHEATAADEARLGVNPMKSSNHRVGHRVGNLVSRTTTDFQMVESSEDKDGGRYRIRTYYFHRVKVARCRNQRVTGNARERSGMLRSIFFKNLRTRARKLDP